MGPAGGVLGQLGEIRLVIQREIPTFRAFRGSKMSMLEGHQVPLKTSLDSVRQ